MSTGQQDRVMTDSEACAVLARAAGWVTPPNPADPFVIRACAAAAIRRLREAGAALGVDVAALGGGS